MAQAQISGKAPGGSNAPSNVPIFPLKAGSYVGEGSWTLDQGVDIATNGSACGNAAPLLAMGAGTVVSHGMSGFGNDAPTLKLDTPLMGFSYIYYGHSGPDGGVPIGTHVNAGQIIGSVGCGIVGISTGPHLEIGFASGPSAPAGSGTAGQMKQLLLSAKAGQPVGGGGGTKGTSTGNSANDIPDALATFINLPSIFQQAEALAFTGKRSFMADQPIMPFIEQLCQGSLRNFMSMPNGNFFAFFPDYFGLFGRKYYWEVRDIEIIDGRVDFSDNPLVTHVAVAGDVTQFHAEVDFTDLVRTSGIFSIFEAISTGYIAKIGGVGKANNKLASQSKTEALAFLQKYGARPYVEKAPMIRSPFFEMFLAFQKFMLLWSKQFQTTLELTFMPEIFPGGLIALIDHGFQVYVEEVEHAFDYTQGFTTLVHISSPSDINQSRIISEGMAHPVLGKK